jgi:hypothetical protein
LHGGVEFSHAAPERTHRRVFEISGLAGCMADPRWRTKVLLRISDMLDRCGGHDDAERLQVPAMRPLAGFQAPRGFALPCRVPAFGCMGSVDYRRVADDAIGAT